MEPWIENHRRIFNTKKSLRYYYLEVFARLIKENLLPGPTLEIGSGPGFLSHITEGIITSDIQESSGINVVSDAHDLHFPDCQFSNVFFVDVMHHLKAPLEAFNEISRVLSPGGRLVMIEPYTSPLSRLFYKYIHHESCRRPDDPWREAFPPGKEPLEGNSEIPRACLVAQNVPVNADWPVSGLRPLRL